MTDEPPARSSIPWWSPHPVAIAAGLFAGAACYSFQTYDGQLGKPPYAEYGLPLVYRWVPRTGFSDPPRFEAEALAVDVLLSVLATLACAASAQVFANLMVGRRRLTLRSMMILVALVALPMGFYATVGPSALILLGPASLIVFILVFGAPFALGLFGAEMALDAVSGYLARDRGRPADRGEPPW